MNPNWRAYSRVAIALVLAISISTVVIHWHQDSQTQHCGLCHVRQMAGAHTVSKGIPANVKVDPWKVHHNDARVQDHDAVSIHFGRAPPRMTLSF